MADERVDVEGGRYGLRLGQPQPLANRADAAWEELQRLQAEARALGVDVDESWPIVRLREEIAAAKN